MAETTRYNPESNYPLEIDDLLCLSDVNLEQLPISEQHKDFCLNGQYTDAGELLENTTMHSLCASLFCLLENRIYTTQDHINNKHSRWYEVYGEESPFEFFDEPTNKTIKPIWANVEDLSRVNIGHVSGSYVLSNAGGFRP